MLTIFGFRKFHLFRGGVLKFFNHSEAELYHREQSSISILNLGLKKAAFPKKSIKASKHRSTRSPKFEAQILQQRTKTPNLTIPKDQTRSKVFALQLRGRDAKVA